MQQHKTYSRKLRDMSTELLTMIGTGEPESTEWARLSDLFENQLSAWAENWSERAAILEYEAGMSRKDAEKEADRICPKPE